MSTDRILTAEYLAHYEWIIGREYHPFDNSYAVDQINHYAYLIGASHLVIISSPYKARMRSRFDREVVATMVNVLDTDSGIRYRCLFDESHVSRKAPKALNAYPIGLLCRGYNVNCNGDIREVDNGGNIISDKFCNCIRMENLMIVSCPFAAVHKDEVLGEYQAYWVTVEDLDTGRHYRIPYHPGWVMDYNAMAHKKDKEVLEAFKVIAMPL